MTAVLFRTPGAIPLDAFNKFGINAKPNSVSPFGFFGTGLKYAVAVILREGGSIRVFIQGVEYQFYLRKADFRGKTFQEVRMRKRKRGMMGWIKSEALPFTTELGRNWKLWQAFRELESNTRDENGESGPIELNEFFPDDTGTDILVDCPGFSEAAESREEDYGGTPVAAAVFLQPSALSVVHDCGQFTMYAGPSRFLYYQGIRVYELEHPARATYDFKPGRVTLSEDRAAANIWNMKYHMAEEIQRIQDVALIEELLREDLEERKWLETDDLTFYNSGPEGFRVATEKIAAAAPSGKEAPRSVRAYIAAHPVVALAPVDPEEAEKTVKLQLRDWRYLLDEIQHTAAELYSEVLGQLELETHERQIDEIGDDIPW